MSPDVPSLIAGSQPITVADLLEEGGVGRKDSAYAGVDEDESAG